MFVKSERYSFKKGLPKKIVGSPLFLLRYQENLFPHNRYAVVVSKKVDKKAVARNRIKRVFIEILQPLDKKSPFDYVFFLKKEILKNDKENIKQELVKSLSMVL